MLLTDTKYNILESYDDEQVIRTCCETNTAEAFQHRSKNTAASCRTLCCNGCQHTSCNLPIELNEQEYLELSADVLEAEEAQRNNINLEITAQSYKVSINQLDEEFGPDLQTMRAREQAMESMVHVEYRCPKCRNCQDCREAHKTEKISLKEEAEDALIRDSVTLDYDNQRFICKLPLRGKPEDFLTTNMKDANKVLDKQVSLYHGEESTKAMIVKAMTKLFNNSHVLMAKR